MAALYPKHPYGHVLEASDYKKVTDGQLKAYLPMLHRPDNTTLVIAGDVDAAQAEKLVRRRFESWKGDDQSRPPRIPAAPALGQGQADPIVVAKDEGLQVEVTAGCRLPAANDPLAAARTRVIKSVIYRAYWNSLRSELGLSYSTDVHPTLSQGGGHLLAKTSIDADRFAEAWPVIESIWRRLKAGDLTDAELRDAQRQALAANNLQINGSSSMAGHSSLIPAPRIFMIIRMRTTVVMDDALYKRARERAAALNVTVSDVVNNALREALARAPKEFPAFEMVTFGDPALKAHHEPADFANVLVDEDEQGFRK